MRPEWIAILTFAAATLVILGAYMSWGDVRRKKLEWQNERLGDEFPEFQRASRGTEGSAFRDLGKIPANPFEDDAAPSQNSLDRFRAFIDQSGLALSPQAVAVQCLSAGVILGIVVWLATDRFLPATLAGLLAATLPLIYVVHRRHRRLEKLRAQLPDVFGLMSRVVRAGQTMSQALLAVSEEFDEPIAGEFAKCYQQQNVGLSVEASLRDLARRTGLLEVRMFVVATIVQWQTGGNLAEALDKLAHVIRERFRIRGMIRAITAEGRMQAGILLALPAFMFGLILLVNYSYASVLFDHPYVLLGVVISECIGAVWIRRIVNFDF